MSSQCPYCGGLVWNNPNQVNAKPLEHKTNVALLAEGSENEGGFAVFTDKRKEALKAVIDEAVNHTPKYTESEVQALLEKQREACAKVYLDNGYWVGDDYMSFCDTEQAILNARIDSEA